MNFSFKYDILTFVKFYRWCLNISKIEELEQLIVNLKKDIQKIYDERTKIRIKIYENTKIGISNSDFHEHNNKFHSQLKEKRLHIKSIQEKLNDLKENN